jgi:hypothetical protein
MVLKIFRFNDIKDINREVIRDKSMKQRMK